MIKRLNPTVQQLITKAAAELVEELLETTRTDDCRTPWFYIIERKMKGLVKATKPRWTKIKLNKTITSGDIKQTNELNAIYKWE